MHEKLEFDEMIELAVTHFGLYSLGLSQPTGSKDSQEYKYWMGDAHAAMMNMQVPMYFDECTPEMIAILERRHWQQRVSAGELTEEPTMDYSLGNPPLRKQEEVDVLFAFAQDPFAMPAARDLTEWAREAYLAWQAIPADVPYLQRAQAMNDQFMERWRRNMDNIRNRPMPALVTLDSIPSIPTLIDRKHTPTGGVLSAKHQPIPGVMTHQERLDLAIQHFGMLDQLMPDFIVSKATPGGLARWRADQARVMDAAGIPRHEKDIFSAMLLSDDTRAMKQAHELVERNIFGLIKRVARMANRPKTKRHYGKKK